MGKRVGHPAFKGLEPAVWHPELVGVVPGYPSTREGHDRRVAALRENTRLARSKGLLTRKGVPNGWAGKKPEIEAIRRNAMTDAEKLADDMVTVGVLDADTSDDALAKEAMTYLMAWMNDATHTDAFRASCARIVMKYTAGMPKRGAPVVETAEGFLAKVQQQATMIRQQQANAAAMDAAGAHEVAQQVARQDDAKVAGAETPDA